MTGMDNTEVTQTGLAVVHRGDQIWSKQGSEAAFAAVTDERGVHFHFPVEIEVRGPGAPPDPTEHINAALERLADHLGG